MRLCESDSFLHQRDQQLTRVRVLLQALDKLEHLVLALHRRLVVVYSVVAAEQLEGLVVLEVCGNIMNDACQPSNVDCDCVCLTLPTCTPVYSTSHLQPLCNKCSVVFDRST